MAVVVLVLAATGCGARPAAAPKASTTPTPSESPAPSPMSPPAPPPSPSTSPSGPASGTPKPAQGPFLPVAVTFVSAKTGWVLGGLCSSCPASLLQTRDGGATWASVPAPPVSLGADSGAGVRAVRFANLNDGWVFGADVWATHDGGAHWQKIGLPGWTPGRVDGLEISAGMIHAVVYDAGMNTFRIESSPVGADNWIASPTTIPPGAGPVPDAQLVLQGAEGWILENDRTVVAGASLVNGSWSPWQPPCTSVNGPATLAAGPGTLVAVCDEGLWGGPPTGFHAYVSDNGTTFHRTRTTAPGGGAVATPGPRVIVVGGTTPTRTALFATFDNGSTWRTVFEGGQYGQWTDLGFTTASQGVAITGPGDHSSATLLMTHDGGHTWHPVPLPAL